MARSPPIALFKEVQTWLERYFGGQDPGKRPPLRPQGTAFQQAVWQQLLAIPHAQTTTYGALAAHLAKQNASGRMSAQAVGQAVGSNPISIIIPCHRVIGANGALTGYAGGLKKKAFLLKCRAWQYFRHLKRMNEDTKNGCFRYVETRKMMPCHPSFDHQDGKAFG